MEPVTQHLLRMFAVFLIPALMLRALFAPFADLPEPPASEIRSVQLLRAVHSGGGLLEGSHYDAISAQGEIFPLERPAYLRFEAGPHCLIERPTVWIPEPLLVVLGSRQELRFGSCVEARNASRHDSAPPAERRGAPALTL